MSVMNTPALMLNNNWQPIGIQSVARSICMAFNSNVKIVDPRDYQQYTWDDWVKLDINDDKVLNLVGVKVRIPEVVVAVNYSGVRHNTIVFNRRNLFIRDENICQYCGKRFSTDDLTVDHIIPRSKGGQSSWLNCVLACISCNRKKADYSLEKIGMSLIRSPFKPKWNPLYRTKVFVPSWERFLSEMYWNVELEP